MFLTENQHLFQFFTCNFTLKYLVSRFNYPAVCEFWILMSYFTCILKILAAVNAPASLRERNSLSKA